MGQILIRGLEAGTVARLKDRAKLNGRSLEGEARSILEAVAGYSVPQAREALRQWRAKFADRRFEDSAAIVREDRDR